MGAGASVTQDEVKLLPQYQILGGDKKWNQLVPDDALDLADPRFKDPYIRFGGEYNLEDKKNTPDFKYIKFEDAPGAASN
jgi:hypothetical protein